MTEPATRLSVLLIDDDEVDRTAVRRALRKGGIDAEVAEAYDFASGRSALLERSVRRDVVLLDLRLPGGDGLELLHEMREKRIDTPVIVLTGKGDEEVAVELMKAGAADYLPKSLLTGERLGQSVRQVLRLRDADRRAREARGALARQALQLQRLAEASIGIHGASTLDEAMEYISQTARELVGTNVALAQLDPYEGRKPIERRASSEKYAKPPSFNADEAATHWSQTVGGARKSVRFTQAELEADAVWRAACERRFQGFTLRGLLAAPLVARDGTIVGSLQVTDRLEGEFDANDEAMLVQLAQTASVALENARLYRSAQEATRARDDVLAIVSHDLRNPLNVVGMSAGMLMSALTEAAGAPAGSIGLVQRIERGVIRMTRLIDDLLDASRIEAGKLSLTLQPLPAAVLLGDATEAALPLAEAQGAQLVKGEVDPALVVRADGHRILQLLSNLVGNALKFVPPSQGRVTLSVVGEARFARFSISDNGPGIPEDHLGHLFERFWQGSESKREGAGLGLFIAKGIVDAHGGRLQVESAQGCGTTVHFWLPLA
jgi:signal transduction histidine kinase/FixJ family two-component response regulator